MVNASGGLHPWRARRWPGGKIGVVSPQMHELCDDFLLAVRTSDSSINSGVGERPQAIAKVDMIRSLLIILAHYVT